MWDKIKGWWYITIKPEWKCVIQFDKPYKLKVHKSFRKTISLTQYCNSKREAIAFVKLWFGEEAVTDIAIYKLKRCWYKEKES